MAKLADMVLLSADPLQDIANTQRIHGVMLSGRWFDRAALDVIILEVKRRVAKTRSTTSLPNKKVQ